jgi:hypothetical protein
MRVAFGGITAVARTTLAVNGGRTVSALRGIELYPSSWSCTLVSDFRFCGRGSCDGSGLGAKKQASGVMSSHLRWQRRVLKRGRRRLQLCVTVACPRTAPTYKGVIRM